jgi:hypothetical protein
MGAKGGWMFTHSIVFDPDRSATAERAVDEAGELAAELGATAYVGMSYKVPQPARVGVKVWRHLCAGHLSEALEVMATDVGAQTIVAHSIGVIGARRVLGSAPNRVSHHANCSVAVHQTETARSGPIASTNSEVINRHRAAVPCGVIKSSAARRGA